VAAIKKRTIRFEWTRDRSSLVNQPLADIQTRWGIDLPKDIFSARRIRLGLLLAKIKHTAFDLEENGSAGIK